MKQIVFMLTTLAPILAALSTATGMEKGLIFDGDNRCTYRGEKMMTGAIVTNSLECGALVCRAEEMRMEFLGCPPPSYDYYQGEYNPYTWPDCCNVE
uniref:Putative kDa family member n=1 Tax=Rhipicephalus microplus TaxID=6941 RepID=A0A6M2CZJ0_RHIMP